VYKSLSIQNFRGFDNLVVKDMAQVNLIAGKNNTGKTAFLEAVNVHACIYNDPLMSFHLNERRGLPSRNPNRFPDSETPWTSLFYDFNGLYTIEISGRGAGAFGYTLLVRMVPQDEARRELAGFTEGGKDLIAVVGSPYTVLEVHCQTDLLPTKVWLISGPSATRRTISGTLPQIPCVFEEFGGHHTLQEDAKRYTALLAQSQDDLLLRALRAVESRLDRLAMGVVVGEPLLHRAIKGGRPMPLFLMGDGMVRLYRTVLAIGAAANGIALIDEVENGLHYSALNEIWRVIGEAARQFNVQVFATTHSFECIRAAHETFSSGDQYDFRLHRLDRVNGAIKAATYDKETLTSAIESNFEVR